MNPTTELLARFREAFGYSTSHAVETCEWAGEKGEELEAWLVENTLPKKEVARVIEEHKGIYGVGSPTANVLDDLSKALGLTEEQ